MTTFEHKNREKAAAGEPMPESLSRWVEEKRLANLILETVRRIGENGLNPVAPASAGVAYRPHTLLAVVTYCYAVGIYGSQDIETLMREDHAFRSLCGQEYPDWRTIRRFRRHNREAIYRSLAATFREAWSLQARGREQTPAAPNPSATWTATSRIPAPSQEQIYDEAEERIERAMFIDSMATED